MPQVSTRRRVPHSAAEMFDLVADVEQYPRFVPFCSALKVRRREPGEGGTEVLIADMTVAYKLIKETFTSRVALNRSQLSIDVKYLNGPFSRMENRWAFHPISDNACEVEFFLFYEFKSRAFALLMGAMFDAVFRRFASAFERRADALYGTA
ncbi:MAG: type II toxin-antitoxin system RatA family toxin [Xanthobacteraceae bacterium]|jgi:coenzyme Q-binding protein COQ10